jgi:ribosomal protein S18 acetylase RimI-like enzyme
MTRLRAMTSDEFSRWRAQTVPAYAADKVRTGRWSDAESLSEAEKELSALLPEGLLSPNHIFFTIESGEISVGALWICRAERAFGPIGYIYDLVVWPEYRRNGHAKQAMLALEVEAERLGFQGLALHVFGHNKSAQDLYVSLGYQPTNINMFKALPRRGNA